MSKHTPGPWHWDSDLIKGDPLGRVRFRVTTTGKTITQCYYSSSDENAQADARLIAAAPELLEALKGLDEAYCRAGSSLTREERHEDRLRLIAARAAIAKATGAEA